MLHGLCSSVGQECATMGLKVLYQGYQAPQSDRCPTSPSLSNLLIGKTLVCPKGKQATSF